MVKATSVLQTPTFKKAVKKLKPNQKQALDLAIQELMANPSIGEQKKGDLTLLRFHKFKMNKHSHCWVTALTMALLSLN